MFPKFFQNRIPKTTKQNQGLVVPKIQSRQPPSHPKLRNRSRSPIEDHIYVPIIQKLQSPLKIAFGLNHLVNIVSSVMPLKKRRILRIKSNTYSLSSSILCP